MERPYQIEAVNAVLSDWDNGIQKTLLVMPTGTGKTHVFANVIKKMNARGKRGLVLAHREELLAQASDKIGRITGLDCAREKAEETAYNSWAYVTVGSVQTLMRQERLERFPKDYYDYIVVDEAHHSLSTSYRNILAYFDKAKLLGVTATPDRGDLRDLGEVFESKAYEYFLPQAIKDGYLCKIKAIMLPLRIELDGVGIQSGDFKAADIDGAIGPYLDAIVNEMKVHCQGRKTLVFLPLVATSQRFRDMLCARGFRAAEVNGESTDRKQILEDFHSGKYDVLCNSMLLTEGYDEPSIDCIVCLRPTKVRSLYAQIIGRGTRPSPGKENLLILDFLWHSERHDLCRPANLICKNQELADMVTQILAEERNGGGMDLEEAVEQGEGSAQEKRESALAEKLEALRRRKRELVDPVRLENLFGDEALKKYEPKMLADMVPPTIDQIKRLEFFNVYAPEIKTKGKADELIKIMENRSNNGLSSAKQIRFLSDRGFKGVEKASFADAKKMIDRFAACNWQMPSGIKPATYFEEVAKKQKANKGELK